MLSLFRFCIPFSYFYSSRLQSKKEIVYHIWYEWLIAFLILLLNNNFQIELTIRQYFFAYFAFISIYEIGYLMNDVYSIRFEAKPRLRIKDFNPKNTELTLWIVARLATFGLITFYLQAYESAIWWGFYISLAVAFYLHNEIKNKQLKVATFFQLAFFRFFSVLFLFLNHELWNLVLLPIAVNYIFYRTLGYLDSKDMLNIPMRSETHFKLYFYLIFSIMFVWFSIISDSFIPIAIHFYYLCFWIIVFSFKLKNVK